MQLPIFSLSLSRFLFSTGSKTHPKYKKSKDSNFYSLIQAIFTNKVRRQTNEKAKRRRKNAHTHFYRYELASELPPSP